MTLKKAVNLVRQKEIVRKQKHLMTNSLFTSPKIDVPKDAKHARQRSISKKPREEKSNHEQLPENKFLRSQMKRNVTDVLVLSIKECTVRHEIHNAIHVEKRDTRKRLAEVKESVKSRVRSFHSILLIMITIYFWVKCTSL